MCVVSEDFGGFPMKADEPEERKIEKTLGPHQKLIFPQMTEFECPMLTRPRLCTVRSPSQHLQLNQIFLDLMLKPTLRGLRFLRVRSRNQRKRTLGSVVAVAGFRRDECVRARLDSTGQPFAGFQ